MNADRRKRIEALKSEIEGLRERVEELATEERDAYDAMPEGLQQSERGEKVESAATELEGAVENLTDAFNALEEAAQ